jgi:hypothetical protein
VQLSAIRALLVSGRILVGGGGGSGGSSGSDWGAGGGGGSGGAVLLESALVTVGASNRFSAAGGGGGGAALSDPFGPDTLGGPGIDGSADPGLDRAPGGSGEPDGPLGGGGASMDGSPGNSSDTNGSGGGGGAGCVLFRTGDGTLPAGASATPLVPPGLRAQLAERD